jgi:hypothetical protein
MLKYNNDYKLNMQNYDQEELLVLFKIPFYLDLLLIYYYVNVRFEKSREQTGKISSPETKLLCSVILTINYLN